MKQITVLFNGVKQQTYLLDLPHVVIGRGSAASIRLDGNPFVSRQHAVIKQEIDVHILEDLGGANGSFIGETRITHHRLQDGDRIVLGKHILRYEAATAQAISLRSGVPGAASETAAAGVSQEPAEVRPFTPSTSSGMPAQGTMAASKEELDFLLEQMQAKAGPHLSIQRDTGLVLFPLSAPPYRIGFGSNCVIRQEGSKWFGKTAGVIRVNRGKWWFHAASPLWNPISVNGSKVKKKRRLVDGSVVTGHGLRFRFSEGEEE